MHSIPNVDDIHRHDFPQKSPKRNEGFTFVELTVAISFMIIAFAGFTIVLIQNEKTLEANAQQVTVNNGFRMVCESIRGTNFTDVVTTHQGAQVVLPGLTNGAITVTILTDETANDSLAAELGLPRDLDGDGVASNANVSGSINFISSAL